MFLLLLCPSRVISIPYRFLPSICYDRLVADSCFYFIQFIYYYLNLTPRAREVLLGRPSPRTIFVDPPSPFPQEGCWNGRSGLKSGRAHGRFFIGIGQHPPKHVDLPSPGNPPGGDTSITYVTYIIYITYIT